MADKFPEIDDVQIENETADSDFLSRERELMGDEFKTEADEELPPPEDDEFEQFESNFPDVQQQQEEAESGEPDKEEETIVAPFQELNLEESKPLQEWKQRREMEISKRDQVAESKAKEMKEDAQKAIDDFYENYNTKKERDTKERKEEESKFLEKRDQLLQNGTIWDRVNELLKLSKTSPSLENSRDKTRFKELLLSLKGKENVPGAAGY